MLSMKKFFVTTSLLLTSVSALAEMYWQADPNPPHFCMQNFNAYGPIYASRKEERTDIMVAELTGKPRCDIIHLQEVWNDSQINQVENGLKSLYTISSPNRQEKIGVMSLMMADMKKTETHDFNINSDGNILDRGREMFNVKKAFHVVQASMYGIDEDFYFMNTHLHPTSQAVRLTQIVDLLQWRLQNTDLKLLLSGDFNGDEHSLERSVIMSLLGVHDSLLETVGGTYPKGLCTYCAGNPLGWLLSDHILDYIFFSNVGRATTHLRAYDGEINLRGTPRKPLSDHFGLRVQFSVEPAQVQPVRSVIEDRRVEALSLLTQMETILGKEKKKGFAEYAMKVRALKNQLQNRQGDFNQYFESYL